MCIVIELVSLNFLALNDLRHTASSWALFHFVLNFFSCSILLRQFFHALILLTLQWSDFRTGD
jgi:hypothetical protein